MKQQDCPQITQISQTRKPGGRGSRQEQLGTNTLSSCSCRLPLLPGFLNRCNLWNLWMRYFVNTSRKNSTARGSPDSPRERIACLRTS